MFNACKPDCLPSARSAFRPDSARCGKMSLKSVKLVRSQGLTVIIYVKVFPHWSLSNGYRLDLKRYQLDRKSEGSFVSYLYHCMVYLIHDPDKCCHSNNQLPGFES